MTDSGANDRWMTFAELAEARRISRASASKLVRRKKWRRQTDNQGSVPHSCPTRGDGQSIGASVGRPLGQTVGQSTGHFSRDHCVRGGDYRPN